jgi:hypothetical protein
MLVVVFWVVTLCSLAGSHKRFGETYHLHLHVHPDDGLNGAATRNTFTAVKA